MLRIPNPAELTAAQREHIAAFVLTYPTAEGTVTQKGPVVNINHTVAEPLDLKPAQRRDILDDMSEDDAIALLTHDQEATLPELAFGATDEAAAAFGSAPVALPPGATVAPSTAVVNPSETAPAGTSATLGTSSESLPPAQTSAAPAAPVAPSTATPAEVDKTGLPWDGRIHSRTKSLKNDGTWTAKRGVDPALVTRVEAELRQVMSAPLASTVQPAESVTTSTVGAVSLGATAPAQVDNGDARQQFIALVGRTSAAINGGKVTQAEVTDICLAAGLPSLPMLANRLDLVAQIAGSIDALIASRG